MTTATIPTFGEATLTDCDREPVHIPGAVQPHGMLLVLLEPELRIVPVSNNMRRPLELAAERMVGLNSRWSWTAPGSRSSARL